MGKKIHELDISKNYPVTLFKTKKGKLLFFINEIPVRVVEQHRNKKNKKEV